ncbi:hypothetical protein [Nibricoccus aquaticus]|uniref:hypothetical protein n=1 Tax=Nibricoccus aquaticus TaxID=2576891 RepID=UPI0010FEE64B|nr:hypothetical protein [Nibricoccus aquaticus]
MRELNDSHIFLSQAAPVLKDAREPFASSTHEEDRKYFVPALGKSKIAQRTDQELKAIYDRFLSSGLFEAFLVASISAFEAFLLKVLREIISEYPGKLSISVPGVSACKTAPISTIFDASSLEEAQEAVIAEHLSGVFYAQPKAYLDYAKKIIGIEEPDDAFEQYLEMKATRDLLVHSDGVINSVYLAKAEPNARGNIGQRLVVDGNYFENSIAALKRIAGIIKRDSEGNFPVRKKEPKA